MAMKLLKSPSEKYPNQIFDCHIKKKKKKENVPNRFVEKSKYYITEQLFC